jgi:hypothetical protein
VRERALVNLEFLLRLRRVVGQAEAKLRVLGALVGEKAVERVERSSRETRQPQN